MSTVQRSYTHVFTPHAAVLTEKHSSNPNTHLTKHEEKLVADILSYSEDFARLLDMWGTRDKSWNDLLESELVTTEEALDNAVKKIGPDCRSQIQEVVLFVADMKRRKEEIWKVLYPDKGDTIWDQVD